MPGLLGSNLCPNKGEHLAPRFWFLNIILQLKESRILEESAVAGKMQVDFRITCRARMKDSILIKTKNKKNQL